MKIDSKSKDSSKNFLLNDLIFGLIAPLGASLDTVELQLSDTLTEFGYRVETISLSATIAQLYQDHYGSKEVGQLFHKLQKGSLARTQLLQDAGDALRIDFRRGDVLAIGAIAQIICRRNLDAPKKGPCAYLIRSLKHSAELQLLRDTYQNRFFSIAVFSSRNLRIANLNQNQADSKGDRERASILVDRDDRRGDRQSLGDQLDRSLAKHWLTEIESERSEEDLNTFGQQLQKIFHQADLFVDGSNDELSKRHVKRFLKLILGNPFATPTKEEFAMFQARAVSLRSADLSRQVGAVIATKSGDIIASGANEVPKFGGGLHWERSDLAEGNDFRDFRFYQKGGIDALGKQKLVGVLNQLSQEGWEFKAPESICIHHGQTVLTHLARRLKELHIFPKGDFGRTVHAEMAALMDAVSRGVCVRGHNVYVTTFPCHQCAKHLIAAGIRQVIFIEPYPKSETVTLWPSEVANFEADEKVSDDRMHLLPFVGIAPSRYSDFFTYRPQHQPRRIEVDGEREVASWRPQASSPNAVLSMNEIDEARFEKEVSMIEIWQGWFPRE